MLKALSKKKTRFPEREDVITSMVFGTMSYLPDRDAFELLKYLISKISTSKLDYITNLFNKKYENINIAYHFWERNELNKEPDLQINIDLDNICIIKILIEIKWNAAQSGENQLDNYSAGLRKEGNINTLFIYLVKDPLTATHEVKRARHNVISIMSWHELIANLYEYKIKCKLNKNVSVWLEDILLAFERGNIIPFSGFEYEGLLNMKLNPENFYFFQSFTGYSKIVTPSISRKSICWNYKSSF